MPIRMIANRRSLLTTLVPALLLIALTACGGDREKHMQAQIDSLNATAAALETELARVNQEYADYRNKREAEAADLASCVAECRKTRELDRAERLYQMASIAATPFDLVDEDKDGRVTSEEFYKRFPNAPADAFNLITGSERKILDLADWQSFKDRIAAAALVKAQAGHDSGSGTMLLPPESSDARSRAAEAPKDAWTPAPTPTPAPGGGTLRLPVPVRRNPQ